MTLKGLFDIITKKIREGGKQPTMEGDSSEDDTATNCIYYLPTDDMSIYKAYLRRVLRRGYAFLRKFSILS